MMLDLWPLRYGNQRFKSCQKTRFRKGVSSFLLKTILSQEGAYPTLENVENLGKKFVNIRS
jgi:hypothetical protein